MTPGIWTCPHCTCENQPSLTVCDACAKTRDAGARDDDPGSSSSEDDADLTAALSASRVSIKEEQNISAATAQSLTAVRAEAIRATPRDRDAVLGHAHANPFEGFRLPALGRGASASGPEAETDAPLLFDDTRGQEKPKIEHASTDLSRTGLIEQFVNAVTAAVDKVTLGDMIREAKHSGLPDLVNTVCFRDVKEDGRTPLAYAVAKNLERVTRDLIDLGALVDTKMGESTTALTLAVTNQVRDGTAIVRLLLSKCANPASLAAAGIDETQLNCTMRYWLKRAAVSPSPTVADLEHWAHLPPMHRLHEIKYSLIGQGIAIEMVTQALSSRFGNPEGRKKPLVMLLLGPPGHGKTCISRNLAKSMVGEENYIEIACGALRDDADLFGSRHGGASDGKYSSDGRLTAFLRARQKKDAIVFLDEFEKPSDLTNCLGWGQGPKIYKALLEPWQEGTLTDVSAGAKLDAKIDCSQVVWILTSNWGQKEIISFAQEKPETYIKQEVGREHLPRVKKELVDKILTPLVMKELKGVDRDVQALARRINCYVPFLPFTEHERVVVADTELRHRFTLYREPAVLQGDVTRRRLYGNLHLQHTLEFAAYAADSYNPMMGADSMIQSADEIDGLFLNKLREHDFKLSLEAKKRVCSKDTPIKKGNHDYAPEPQFWAHFDNDTEQIVMAQIDPSGRTDRVFSSPAEVVHGVATSGTSAAGGTPARTPRQLFTAEDPFDH